MSSYEPASTIARAIERAVIRSGLLHVRALPENSEQVAIDIIDALEAAGFQIVCRNPDDGE